MKDIINTVPNFRIAYFKVKGQEDNPSNEPGLVKAENTEGSVLEIGLIPADDSVGEAVQGELYRLPPGTKVIKLRAGDLWPDAGRVLRFFDEVHATGNDVRIS